MKKLDVVSMWEQKYFLEKKDIEELLLHFLWVSKTELFQMDEIPDEKLEQIEAGFKRVMRTEPVAYVTGVAHFYGREFVVDSRVLVPRIDTEVLVSQVLDYAKTLSEKVCLSDIGTGSGCIGQSIFLSQNPQNIEKLFAFDISAEAVEVAKINAKKHGIEEKVTFFAEGFESFDSHFQETIYQKDIQTYIITANLPYIRTVDLWGMEASVFFHEPSVALFWWRGTGFELYRRFITLLQNIQAKNPEIHLVLFMEFWYDQYEESKEFLTQMWVKFQHYKDTNNIWRVIQVDFR